MWFILFLFQPNFNPPAPEVLVVNLFIKQNSSAGTSRSDLSFLVFPSSKGGKWQSCRVAGHKTGLTGFFTGYSFIDFLSFHRCNQTRASGRRDNCPLCLFFYLNLPGCCGISCTVFQLTFKLKRLISVPLFRVFPTPEQKRSLPEMAQMPSHLLPQRLNGSSSVNR